MSSHLLNAIGLTDLITYFELLDTLLNGPATKTAAVAALQKNHPGMARYEARVIATAWRDTHTNTKPADDRALDALEWCA